MNMIYEYIRILKQEIVVRKDSPLKAKAIYPIIRPEFESGTSRILTRGLTTSTPICGSNLFGDGISQTPISVAVRSKA
jgi:hypothetical protein